MQPTDIIQNQELYNNNFFDVLPHIADKSIDVICADLPYGNKIRAKWDTPIDLSRMWEQYKRIIKPNGVILLFAAIPFDKILGCSNLPWLKYEWIWEKTQATGYFNAKKRPMVAHETVLTFYDKQPKYYPQKTTGHKPINSYTKRVEVCNKTEVYGKVKIDISGGGETDRYPRSVLKFSSDKQKNKLDGTIHSTQKPLALIEYLLKTYSDENDLILDNTAGSMTVQLASMKLNRRSIGIEMDEKIYASGLRRLKNNLVI